jgi:hypothetical protein
LGGDGSALGCAFRLFVLVIPLLVIPAKAGIQLLSCDVISAQAGIHFVLALRPVLETELRLAYGEPVTFWHCPKSNQKS